MEKKTLLRSREFLFGGASLLLTCFVCLALAVPASYGADPAEQVRLERELQEASQTLVTYCTTGDVWRYDNLRPTLLRAVAPFGTIFNPPKAPVIHLSPGSPYYRPIVGQMMYHYYFCASRKERLIEFMAAEQEAEQPAVLVVPPKSLADVDEERRCVEYELDNARASYGRACGWAWPYINLRPLCQAEGFEPATILNPFVPVPTTRLSEANPDYKLVVATLATWGPKIPNAKARMNDLRDDHRSALASAGTLQEAGQKVELPDKANLPKDPRLADMLTMYDKMKPALRQWRKDQHEIEAFAEPIFIAETLLARMRVQIPLLVKQIWLAEHDKKGRYVGPAVFLRNQLLELQTQIVAVEQELAKIHYEIARLRQEQASLAGQISALLKPWLCACDVMGRLGPAVHQTAMPLFDQLIADEPRLWQPYLARGAARLSLGKHKEALADLVRTETKLRLHGSPPGLIAFVSALQAHALCKGGDIRGGMKQYKDIKKQYGHTWSFFLVRGWSHLESRKYSSAKADFQAALRLSKKPPQAEPHEAMAFLLATCPDDRVRDGEEAVKQARIACDLTKSRNWVCLNTLGAAYAEKGDFDSAAQFAKKALEFAPPESRPEIVSRMALYHEKHTYRLAGPLEEPAKAPMRDWTDRTGKFRTKAIFVGLRDGKVSLKKKNEKVVVVPLDVLSEKDKEYVRQEAAGDE